MNIFIWRDNEEFGPLSRSEIFSCLFRGELSNDDPARTETDEEWRPLREVLQATASGFPPTGLVTNPMESDPMEPPSGMESLEGAEEPATTRALSADEESAAPLEEPESSSGLIFVRQNDGESGPYNREELFAALFRGEFSNDDYGRREGETGWRPLGKVLASGPKLFLFPQQEKSAPPRAVEIELDTEEKVFPLITPVEVLPRRSLLEMLNPRVMVATGVVGLIVVFAEPHFAPKGKMTPSSIAVPQPAIVAGTPVAPRPSSTAAVTPLYVQVVRSPAPLAAAAAPSSKHIEKIASASTPPGVVLRAQQTTAQVRSVASKTATPVPKTASKPKAVAPTEDLLAKVRQIKLLALPEGYFAHLWIADTAQKPRAIMTVCLEGGGEDRAIRDQAWQKFAIDNQLALVAISFSFDSKLVKSAEGYSRADQWSGNLLLDSLDRIFGKTLPIILYGKGAAGKYTANFAAWRPDRLLVWAAYTDDWLLPEPVSTTIPAIIACDQDDARGMALGKQLFSQGRLEDKPWTWVPLGIPWSERGTQLDCFVRDYLEGVISRSSGESATPDIWVDNSLRREMSNAERLAARDEASWMPSQEAFQQWLGVLGDSVPTAKPVIIEKDIVTKCRNQPLLKLYLRLPPGAVDGKGVSGVLAYCTWEDNDANIVGKLSTQTKGKPRGEAALVLPFLVFAEQHNLAVLTWGTEDVWNDNLSTEELEHRQQEEFDHNFDLVADAWARGVTSLSQQTGIPQKDFLLYGISRGAQWAHRLALRKPEYFLAVHIHIASTFDTPTPEATKPLWLVTTGEQEYGYERAQTFYEECRALGYPIIFKAIMGLGHSDCAAEHALGLEFFEYALSLKNARDAWLGSLNDPFRVLKVQQNSNDQAWLASFRAPPFYGDFLNQDSYPADQIDMIPEALRVPLPTKQLADLWNK